MMGAAVMRDKSDYEVAANFLLYNSNVSKRFFVENKKRYMVMFGKIFVYDPETDLYRLEEEE